MQLPTKERVLDLVFPLATDRHEMPGGMPQRSGDDRLTVRFWGTRGGVARAGQDTARFGGNTLCVTVELDRDQLFVFDASTGMINLGQFIATRKRSYRYHLFISNPC
jgi:phosphoribosyl 1,2-cyclic phosphodiesterase